MNPVIKSILAELADDGEAVLREREAAAQAGDAAELARWRAAYQTAFAALREVVPDARLWDAFVWSPTLVETAPALRPALSAALAAPSGGRVVLAFCFVGDRSTGRYAVVRPSAPFVALPADRPDSAAACLPGCPTLAEALAVLRRAPGHPAWAADARRDD